MPRPQGSSCLGRGTAGRGVGFRECIARTGVWPGVAGVLDVYRWPPRRRAVVAQGYILPTGSFVAQGAGSLGHLSARVFQGEDVGVGYPARVGPDVPVLELRFSRLRCPSTPGDYLYICMFHLSAARVGRVFAVMMRPGVKVSMQVFIARECWVWICRRKGSLAPTARLVHYDAPGTGLKPRKRG